MSSIVLCTHRARKAISVWMFVGLAVRICYRLAYFVIALPLSGLPLEQWRALILFSYAVPAENRILFYIRLIMP